MAHKIYKILILIILSFLVNGQQFMPVPRRGHTATILGSKIYYIGGYHENITALSDFFYLDEKFTWVDLKSQGAKFPLTLLHTSDIGGANQDSIFIIGGLHIGETNENYVYRFDTKTNATSIPIIQGKTPPRRENIDSVSYGGKIYMFSGITRDNNNINNIAFIDSFDVLDTVNLRWEVGNILYGPLPSSKYTATLVNGVIYYIGGIQQNGLDQIYGLMTNVCM